jgi:hypothetical protein
VHVHVRGWQACIDDAAGGAYEFEGQQQLMSNGVTGKDGKAKGSGGGAKVGPSALCVGHVCSSVLQESSALGVKDKDGKAKGSWGGAKGGAWCILCRPCMQQDSSTCLVGKGYSAAAWNGFAGLQWRCC